MTGKSSVRRKVTLVIPNTAWYDKRPVKLLEYAIVILTALLKEKFDFSIVDANGRDLSVEQCKAEIESVKPDIVLISCMCFEYFQHFKTVITIAKEVNPESVTIIGGVYPTLLGSEALKDTGADYAFRGHSEERIEKFLNLVIAEDMQELRRFDGICCKSADGAIIDNPVKSFISDVAVQIKPDYSLIDFDHYVKQTCKDYQFNSDKPAARILTSYGCPYNCIFCATRGITGKGVAYRDVEDILEEIEYLMSNHNVQSLVFLDDFFLAKKDRCLKLMNEFIKRKLNLTWKIATVSAWHVDDEILECMKKSGCTQITISVESGNERVLHKIIRKPLKLEKIPPIVKKCKEVGIDIGANFVIGFPGETWDELLETFAYAEKCDFDLTHFHIATPLPQTDLYRIAKDQNLLEQDFSFTDPRFFGFGQGFITTDEFNPFELQVLRAFEWDRINFNTSKKRNKVAKMMGLSLDDLKRHRQQTRRKLGIYF